MTLEKKYEFDDLLEGIAIDGESVGGLLKSRHSPYSHLFLAVNYSSVVRYFHHRVLIGEAVFHIWSINEHPSLEYVVFQLIRNSRLLRDFIDVNAEDLGFDNNDL